ncbi:hypothetical protein B484DRAFT_391207 [Ochromonadaceae sp. CCMP2298]|nr:hypothetical protein B484DRAFT_391207 [Ochromonadaceae sp. CCMP2298]
MERAKELRMMMKMGKAGGVSGKDKMQQLKLMKEQQREKAAAPAPARPAPRAHAASSGLPAGFFDDAPPRTAPAPASAPARAPAPAKAGLPAGFFDAEAPVIPAPTPAASMPASMPASSSASVPVAGAGGASSLPAGFFDDPVEALQKTKGLTLQQYAAQVDKEEQAQVRALLKDIGGEGQQRAEEEAEEAETADREREDGALQIAYLASLLRLRKQAGASGAGTSEGAGGGAEAEGEEAERLLLGLLESTRQEREADADPDAGADAAQGRKRPIEDSALGELDAILFEKLAQSKRRKQAQSDILSKLVGVVSSKPDGNEEGGEEEESEEESEEEEDLIYTPYVDWTSQGL